MKSLLFCKTKACAILLILSLGWQSLDAKAQDGSCHNEQERVCQNDWQRVNVTATQKNSLKNSNSSADAQKNEVKVANRPLKPWGSEREPWGSERAQAASTSQNLDHEFWVHDADSYLYHDDDGDGFYQAFIIDFDIDVSTGYADVYAEVYIRAPGDSWRLLYTTDLYEIYEQDGGDALEVETELLDGYIPDYYDILIDVWEYTPEADYLVATYSEADDSDLYQLPLEDADEDVYYYEDDVIEVEVTQGGSSETPLIISLLLFIWLRHTYNNQARKSD